MWEKCFARNYRDFEINPHEQTTHAKSAEAQKRHRTLVGTSNHLASHHDRRDETLSPMSILLRNMKIISGLISEVRMYGRAVTFRESQDIKEVILLKLIKAID